MPPIAFEEDRLLTAGQAQLDDPGALAYSLFASVERLTELNRYTIRACVGRRPGLRRIRQQDTECFPPSRGLNWKQANPGEGNGDGQAIRKTG